MGDGLGAVFWGAVAVAISGMAAWGSTMLMRLIDQRIDQAVQRVLGELDAVEERLEAMEARLSAPTETALLVEPSDEAPVGRGGI